MAASPQAATITSMIGKLVPDRRDRQEYTARREFDAPLEIGDPLNRCRRMLFRGRSVKQSPGERPDRPGAPSYPAPRRLGYGPRQLRIEIDESVGYLHVRTCNWPTGYSKPRVSFALRLDSKLIRSSRFPTEFGSQNAAPKAFLLDSYGRFLIQLVQKRIAPRSTQAFPSISYKEAQRLKAHQTPLNTPDDKNESSSRYCIVVESIKLAHLNLQTSTLTGGITAAQAEDGDKALSRGSTGYPYSCIRSIQPQGREDEMIDDDGHGRPQADDTEQTMDNAPLYHSNASVPEKISAPKLTGPDSTALDRPHSSPQE
ncbi:hypothetical protein MBM_01410 [Drepanopeziza brunnea f. sp. 'multigermtubi' MB_m1]|uniref:Uncharacterized protein n=1 Tax=Marssonina brunnea f. sp. multigermtubi (strain MB_m1) TaxID=1072389 RepID=K1XJ65_MARBU|nr:uncharacterized protein MBM_01410 [Drepanopeziza brunnea f. sp. 'multigermtubi' MB_m1]EKD20728.1 hypothetical protein MBM_01410 [Drepanopeziza brunnea f. sp. 'multigermtubi' MB_m1]